LVLATLGACATTPERLSQVPLPSPEALQCCWQSEESVRITTPQHTLRVSAAVAVTPGKLVVVILDGIGRPLVSLSHEGGEPRTLGAPSDWSPSLTRQLLLAVYLHRLDSQQWHFDNPGWSLDVTANGRSLRYRGRELVRLRYPVEEPEVGNPREVEYIGQGIHLAIHDLTRTAL
jgi:hypothetical protein